MKQFDAKKFLIYVVGIIVICIGLISFGFDFQMNNNFSEGQLNYMGTIISAGLTLTGTIITSMSFFKRKRSSIGISDWSMNYFEEYEEEGVIDIEIEIENLSNRLINLEVKDKLDSNLLESKIEIKENVLRGNAKNMISIQIRILDVETYLAEYHKDVLNIEIRSENTNMVIPVCIENISSMENENIDEKYKCKGRDIYCWIEK